MAVKRVGHRRHDINRQGDQVDDGQRDAADLQNSRFNAERSVREEVNQDNDRNQYDSEDSKSVGKIHLSSSFIFI